MTGVRALMVRVLLPVTVIIWLIMRAAIPVQAASTENKCRAENRLSNSPLTNLLSTFKRTFVHAEENVLSF
jgi:hypothetical protein